ncbi:hypothetical protein BCR39DRAFT_552317 [Naematelia encephala]|uniref:UBA domain-containing protein n=1 Tax=Naematelia encephala TaxID=71784 RepID=A0A1Y2AIB6_9TREE|nr:hypothetical protein BCR39DRAFT_552317 [Naematelia encephala]
MSSSDDHLVKQLKDLGIPEKSAKFALSKHNGDVTKAADYVFSGNAGKDEVSSTLEKPQNQVVSPRPLASVPEGEPLSTSSLDPHLISTPSPDPNLLLISSPHPNLLTTPSPNPNPLPSPESQSQSPEDISPASSTSKRWGGILFRRKTVSSFEEEASRGSEQVVSPPEKKRGRSRSIQQPQSEEPILTKSSSQSLSPFNDQSSNLILGALGRPPSTDTSKRSSGLFGLKPSSSSTPTSPPAEEKAPKVSIQKSTPVGGSTQQSSRSGRAPSPFFRARRSRDQARARDASPEVGALQKDKEPDQDQDAESDGESVGAPKRYRPQSSAYEDGDESPTDAESEETDEEEGEDEDEYDVFDEETEKNTEANAVFYEGDAAGLSGPATVVEEPIEDDDRSVLDKFGEETEQDILGEGPNVVVPSVQPFAAPNAPKRSKSLKTGLELVTGRPSFARDRCTITLSQGDPDGALEVSGKRLRRYVVLSDLSDESRYAVEWAIGTVARDGDELFIISVKEDENKVDPKSWSKSDAAKKLQIQKERQTTTLLLVRQVTSLLQRTHLNITITCQFLHAKNARHMLLDLIDFLEPTMVIVGSRGLGKLNSILLGSTSHYLVQKSSVPVMVARRRLQRPLRKTNPADLRHSPRVSLASASIEKTASSKQEDEDIDVANEVENEGVGSGDAAGSVPVVAGGALAGAK